MVAHISHINTSHLYHTCQDIDTAGFRPECSCHCETSLWPQVQAAHCKSEEGTEGQRQRVEFTWGARPDTHSFEDCGHVICPWSCDLCQDNQDNHGTTPKKLLLPWREIGASR